MSSAMNNVSFIKMGQGTREEYEFLDQLEDQCKRGLPARLIKTLAELEH